MLPVFMNLHSKFYFMRAYARKRDVQSISIIKELTIMVYTKNLILVCTGRDTTKAASLGMPVLQLCLGISPSGALQRLKVSAVQRHCLLGVTDPPQEIIRCSAVLFLKIQLFPLHALFRPFAHF